MYNHTPLEYVQPYATCNKRWRSKACKSSHVCLNGDTQTPGIQGKCTYTRKLAYKTNTPTSIHNLQIIWCTKALHLGFGRDAVGRDLSIVKLGLCPGNLCSITLIDHILVCQLSVSYLWQLGLCTLQKNKSNPSKQICCQLPLHYCNITCRSHFEVHNQAPKTL